MAVAQTGLVLLLASGVLACGEAGKRPDGRGEPDATRPADDDAASDAPFNTGPAADADTSADTDTRADTDTNADTSADAAADAGPDAAPEVIGDAGLDADDTGCEVYAVDKTLCFGPGPPGPGDPVQELPAPDMKACKLPVSGIVDYFFGGKLPESKVGVELGIIGPGGFEKYADKGWVKLVQGIQGGFHVWVAIRLTIPGLPPTAGALERKTITEISGWDGCSFTALNYSKTIYPAPVKGAFVQGSPAVPGVQLRYKKPTGRDMPSLALWEVCGRWLSIRADFYNPHTKTFGRKWLQVRTHAAKAPPYGLCK